MIDNEHNHSTIVKLIKFDSVIFCEATLCAHRLDSKKTHVTLVAGEISINYRQLQFIIDLRNM